MVMMNEVGRGRLRYIANIGGFGSGKTYAGAMCAWLMAMNRPGTTGIVASVTYPQLRDTAMLEFEKVGEENGWYERTTHFKKADRDLYFKNGSKIMFRSMEIGRKILSVNIHWFWLDQVESVRKEYFNYLVSRLRATYPPSTIKRYGHIANMGVLTANPLSGGWFDKWVKDFIHLRELPKEEWDGKQGAWVYGKKKSRGLLMRTATTDNVHLERSYVDDMINQFGGKDSPMTQRLVFGMDTPFGGTIYKNFREEHHVIPDFDIPNEWEKWSGIDFGFINPFVYLLFARDQEGRTYLVFEHYMREREMSFHARVIRQAERRFRYDYGSGRQDIPRYADHDRQDQEELAQQEVFTANAKKDIIPGIFHVIKLLSPMRDGRPGLLIFESCANTIREFGDYAWDEKAVNDAPAKYKTGNLDEGEPYGDHAMDALRYGLYSHHLMAGDLSASFGRRPRGPFDA